MEKPIQTEETDTDWTSSESEEENEPSPSGLEVVNGSLTSELHDRIYFPPGLSPIKGEPDDELEGTPGEELLQADIGEVSFDETNLPACMFECCYCKILFTEPGALSDHLQEVHPGMKDIDSNLEKLATDTKQYQVETKAKDIDESNNIKVAPKKKRNNKDLHIVCDYPGCGKTFIRRGALQTHQVVHDVSKVCPHCQLDFKTITALLRHIERKHNVTQASRIDCTYPGCNKTFNNPWDLNAHQVVHDEDKRCCICGMMFAIVTSLHRHMWTVHKPAEGNAAENTEIAQMIAANLTKNDGQCKTQKMIDESLYAAEDDSDEIDEEEDSAEIEGMPYTCSHEGCTLIFESKLKLRWHLKYTLHHESQFNDHPFHCPYKSCELLFQDKNSLCDHMKEEHWGTKKIKTAAAAKLAKEQREARMQKQKLSSQLKCPVCCENFTNESKMKQHLKKRHSARASDDQSDSEMLNETTAKASEPEGKLLDGALSKKQVFDLQMFKCPMCHASYHTINGLKYHFKHHHGCQTALSYLMRLNNSKKEFMGVVPAKRYGDTFKNQKQKTSGNREAFSKSSGTISSTSMRKVPDMLNDKLSESSRKLKYLQKSESLGKEDIESENEDSVELNKDDSDVCDDVDETFNAEGRDIVSNYAEMYDMEDMEGMDEDSNDIDDALRKADELDKMFGLDNSANGDDEDDKTIDETEDGAAKDGKQGNPMCRYPSCSKVFQNRFELMRHQRTHEKLLKCPNDGCDQAFFNSNNLRLHIQLVHAELQDTKCKDCGIIGKRSYIIYRHPKYCPKTVNLKCPQCGKTFEKVSSFTNHARSHEKRVRANYACEYDGCSKKFRTRQDRTRHHNVHSGARPHSCPYANCDKTYKQRPHLLVHLKASHTIRKDGERKTFTCEYCGSVFKHSCGRMKHIRKSCLEGPNGELILENRKQRSAAKST